MTAVEWACRKHRGFESIIFAGAIHLRMRTRVTNEHGMRIYVQISPPLRIKRIPKNWRFHFAQSLRAMRYEARMREAEHTNRPEGT